MINSLTVYHNLKRVPKRFDKQKPSFTRNKKHRSNIFCDNLGLITKYLQIVENLSLFFGDDKPKGIKNIT